MSESSKLALRAILVMALVVGLGPVLASQVPADASATGIAARYLLDGETHQVSNVDLALELARRERLRPRGQGALDDLIHRTLVAQAAREAGLSPTQDEIDSRIRKVEESLRSRGMDLERFLEEKQMSRRAFENDYIGLSIAHEALVMREAGLRSRDEVTPELLELWLDETRTRVGVVIDMEQLSSGEVARIGSLSLSMADLGEVLRQNSPRQRLEAAVRQIVVRRLLDAAANEAEIEVTEQEMRAEVEDRRQRIESDPTLRGAKFEDVLRAQGTTIELLRKSPVIRAQVQRRKLAELRNPDEAVDAYIRQNRAAVLLDHGPRRRVHAILTRAAETPTEFIPLDFEAGFVESQAVRARILDQGISFGVAAKIHSDDAASKVKGGDLGMLAHRSSALPREVLDAAFDSKPFLISLPIRTDEGYYLVMVSDIEDIPGDDVLRRRVIEERSGEFVRDLLEAAQIRLSEKP